MLPIPIPEPLLPAPLGLPLSLLYGSIAEIRRQCFDHGLLRAHRTSLRTISVGGIEAGGSGKTPIARLLAGAFLKEGHRVGLLSRGYGRPTTEPFYAAADGPLPTASQVGDEPAMIARDLEGRLAIAANKKRIDGARWLLEQGMEVAILDDGFAHRRLHRDVDIVVLRGHAPLGTGHLLPWGTLRESPKALKRAQVLWLHFRAPDHAHAMAEVQRALLQEAYPNAHVVVSTGVAAPAQMIASDGLLGPQVTLSGKRVVAAAAIAHPADFSAAIEGEDAKVLKMVPFADHHRFSVAELSALAQAVKEAQGDALMMTPKDTIKLLPEHLAALGEVPLWQMGVKVVILHGVERLGELLGCPIPAV